MQAGFELFDHTADIGLCIRAPTLEALVPAAIQGLYAVIGQLLPDATVQLLPFQWERRGDSSALLLRDCLAELLLIFERNHRIAIDLVVRRFTEHQLNVDAQLALVDVALSEYDHEVKAITYHELAVRQVPGGYEARIIVDI